MTRAAVLWLLTSVAIVFFTYVPQMGAPLELQDDHRIIAPLITPHPNGIVGGLRMWASEIRSDVQAVGRFRPVNQFFDVCLPLILGPNPLVWHAVSLSLAIAVAILLYAAAWMVWRSPTAAAVFALVTLLAPDPGPTTTWYRPGPKEAWGVLLLAAALLVMIEEAGKADWGRELVSFVLVLLTAFSKESFLLLIPALFGVRLWLEARASDLTLGTALRKLRFVAFAYSVLLLTGCAAILFVVSSAGTRSYGGQSLGMSRREVADALMRDIARAPSLAVWFVPVILACWVTWQRKRRIDAFGIVIFLSWVGPQYVLYGTRGGFWDHYWIPCVVAFAAANAASVAVLATEPVLYRLAIAVFVIWLINAVRIDVCAVRNFRERARVQQTAVRIAAAHVKPESLLIVIADPREQSETAPSFVDFVRVEGGRFRGALLLDSHSRVDSAKLNGSVIVHLDQKVGRSNLSPAFDRVHASGHQEYLSLKQRGWVTIPFVIDIDVRKGA